MATNIGRTQNEIETKCDAKEEKKRGTEITTAWIVYRKGCKSCVFYNGVEVSPGRWGGCKVNIQFSYRKMKAKDLMWDEVWIQGVDKPVFEEAEKVKKKKSFEIRATLFLSVLRVASLQLTSSDEYFKTRRGAHRPGSEVSVFFSYALGYYFLAQ
jgi:hypothetical protein